MRCQARNGDALLCAEPKDRLCTMRIVTSIATLDLASGAIQLEQSDFYLVALRAQLVRGRECVQHSVRHAAVRRSSDPIAVDLPTLRDWNNVVLKVSHWLPSVMMQTVC